MGNGFLDTRDTKRLRLVCNLLTYPTEFCCKESNVALLTSTVADDAAAVRLIGILRSVQTQARGLLPMKGTDSAWKDRQTWIKKLNVSTLSVTADLPQSTVDSLQQSLDIRLLEGVMEIRPNDASGLPTDEALQVVGTCVWLSELLALVVLGIASADLVAADTVQLKPANELMGRHLRRLWFGSAFEEVSLRAASVAIERLAIAASEPAFRPDLSEARINALTVFPQHWRLPVDQGPVPELLFSHLEPLLAILIHSIVAAQHPGKLMPFGLQHAKEKDIEEIFTEVLKMQSSLPGVDRLFETENGCLTLGSRSLASGAIAIAEHLAAKALGKDWHGTRTSAAQKSYIIERLRRNSHVDVLDFELRQHDTEDKVDLDVDFFVRDRKHEQLYGVQLKHLETNSKGGVLHWVSRFRERDTGLGNLVRQLENLPHVAKYDRLARKKLVDNGISICECDRIVPVGLHNLGVIDCWEVQNGTLLYDMHTFANVLAGRVAVGQGVKNGQFFRTEVASCVDGGASPCEPDAVIDAYQRDPQFLNLLHFDVARYVRRSLKIAGSMVVAEGLGI